MAYIFFNEFGSEPIAYIGPVDTPNEIAVVLDSIHEVYVKKQPVSITVDIHDSLHMHYTILDYNAAVIPNCNRFLQVSGYKRYLQTVRKNRYLQTKRIEC
jgi:hypothetical protein